MKKSEPKMVLNISLQSEEFEQKVKIAMDKYVEDVIYKNLDEEIMRIVDKRINRLISSNSWASERKIQGVTLEQFVKDRTEKALGDFIERNIKEILAKRLTEIDNRGKVFFPLKQGGKYYIVEVGNKECWMHEKAFDKLAQYEDLEESGKLQIFPCAVGDTVYVDSRTIPTMNMDFETLADVPPYFMARVVSCRQNSKGKFIKLSVRAKWLHEWIDLETGRNSEYFEMEKYFTYPISAVGKTIFLTSDEAEEKLEGAEVQNGKT